VSLRAVPLRLSWHSVSSDMMVALGPCSRIEVLGAILDCKWSVLSRTTSFCFCGRVQTCSTLAQKQAPSGARERLGPDNHSTSMSVCTKGLAISIDRHLPPCLHLAGTKGSSPVDQRTGIRPVPKWQRPSRCEDYFVVLKPNLAMSPSI